MRLKAEEIHDYLAKEGKTNLTKDQFIELVNKHKANSPVNDLNNIGEIESLQMQMLEQQANTISTLMNKVFELEAKVNA